MSDDVRVNETAPDAAESVPATDRAPVKAGEKGVNRVWIEQKKGRTYLGYKTPDGRKRLQRCRAKGKRELQKAATALARQLALQPRSRQDEVGEEPITVGRLLDEYRNKLLPLKNDVERGFQETVLDMFERQVGRDLIAVELDESHWLAYIQARTTGNPDPDLAGFDAKARAALAAMASYEMPALYPASYHEFGPGWRVPRPVGKRAIEREGKVLRKVFAYGHNRHRRSGTPWLPVNPFEEFRLPSGDPGECATISAKEYEQLLEVAPSVHPDLRDLLVALHETGHRGGAVCALRWADVRLAGEGTIHWPRETDKTDRAHVTPISEVMLAMLRARLACLVGPLDSTRPVFPGPSDSAVPMRLDYARGLLLKALTQAGLEARARFGTHVFRRKMATDHMDQPLKVVAAVGGWKDTRSVVHYQQVAEAAARALLNRPRPA